MGNLNRNRLIGGGVLLLASLLFVPAILTPTEQPLSNPDLPVSSISKPKVIVNNTVTPPKVPSKTNTLSLESLADETAKPQTDSQIAAAEQPVINKPNQPVEDELITKAEDLLPKTKKNLVPIKLESLGASNTATSAPTLKTQKQESWVRVGSFSNLKNADALAAELKRKNYSVKIENTKISGKPYRRVLIGPFSSDKEMRKVLNQIQLEGFSPNVQR